MAAFLWLLVCAMLPVGFGLMAWGVYSEQREWFQYGAWSLAAVVPVVIFQWMTSLRAFCPLCLVPSLASKSCQKNRKARKLFGSYRTRVALSVMFRGHFVCPYCGEPTCVQVKAPTNGQPPTQKQSMTGVSSSR